MAEVRADRTAQERVALEREATLETELEGLRAGEGIFKEAAQWQMEIFQQEHLAIRERWALEVTTLRCQVAIAEALSADAKLEWRRQKEPEPRQRGLEQRRRRLGLEQSSVSHPWRRFTCEDSFSRCTIVYWDQ